MLHRLNGVDAQWLAADDGRQHTHVCLLTILEGAAEDGASFDLPRLRGVLEERIHLIPIFRRRLKQVPLDLDYPVFVEDAEFDIDSHLWEMAVPEPGTDQQLAELVARIASRPLDKARPLWEIHVIHGLEHGRVAMLTKIHHAAVDGVSGIELLSILLDDTAEGRDVEPEPPMSSPESEPSDVELLARGVGSLPRQVARAARSLPRTLRHLDQVPTMRNLPGAGTLSTAADETYRLLTRHHDGEIVTQPAGKAPRISMGGPVSPHRRFAFASLDLPTVKAIKAQLPGLTVNDVVIALCAGAMRRRLLARGDDLSEPLIAGVPISTGQPGKTDSGGNHISMMYVQIPTDRPDVVERLQRSHEVMIAAKTLHNAVPVPVMQNASYATPAATLARAARTLSILSWNGWVDPPHNVTISNIPGSRVPLYCAGARVIGQYPVNVLLDGLAASLTVLSYQDDLNLGITVDRDNVPDVWDLADDFITELDEMAMRLIVSDAERPSRR